MKQWWICRAEDDGVKLAADCNVMAATARIAAQDYVEELAREGALGLDDVVTVRVGADPGNSATGTEPVLTHSFRFVLRWQAHEIAEQRDRVA